MYMSYERQIPVHYLFCNLNQAHKKLQEQTNATTQATLTSSMVEKYMPIVSFWPTP